MPSRIIAERDIDTGKGVRFTAQELTGPQKAQARSNIGAGSQDDVDVKAEDDLSNLVPNAEVLQGTVSSFVVEKTYGNAAIKTTTGRQSVSSYVYQGIVAKTENNLDEGVVSFPVALVSAGFLNQVGGLVFGGYDEARVYVRGSGIGRETGVYNESGLAAVPSPIPDFSFGYASGPLLIGHTIGASGDPGLNCSIAQNISRNGDMGRPWHVGTVLARNGVLDYGLFSDASSTEGAQWPVWLETPGRTNDVALTIKVKGTPTADRRVFNLRHASGSEVYPDNSGTGIQTGSIHASMDHNGSLMLGEDATGASDYKSRLTVAGSFTVTTSGRSLTNVVSVFAADANPASSIGAAVVTGVDNGDAPYVAALGATGLPAPLTFKAMTASAVYEGLRIQASRQAVTALVPFEAPPFAVADLPSTGVVAGAVAYATDGRNYNGTGTLEGPGAGTGCLVSYNGSAWKIVGTNQTVSA